MEPLLVCCEAPHRVSIMALRQIYLGVNTSHLQPMDYAITMGHKPWHIVLPLLG